MTGSRQTGRLIAASVERKKHRSDKQQQGGICLSHGRLQVESKSQRTDKSLDSRFQNCHFRELDSSVFTS